MGYKEEGRGKYWFGPLRKTFGSAETEESVLVVEGGGWRGWMLCSAEMCSR